MLTRCLRHPWRLGRWQSLRSPSTATLHTFAENDYAVLRASTNRTDAPLFVGPLTPGKRLVTHKGSILHDHIIDRPARSVISTQNTKAKRFAQYRLHEATLEDYVRLTRRLVTPIYPSDAHLIVSLFDFHPETFDGEGETAQKQEPDISILEAGTGHGALTLYLSRAIHAANSLAPKESSFENSESYAEDLEAWKRSRRAVVHTVDVSATYSKHASKIVKGFRRGMYHANVNFNVSDVGSWVHKALDEKDGHPFLTHAFLDLPSADAQVDIVAQALDIDSTLIVFTPSITQITELMLKVKKEDIPLQLEKVVELGVNGGSGGREWDVRPVRPRALIKALDAVDTLEEPKEVGVQDRSVTPTNESDGDGTSSLLSSDVDETSDATSVKEIDPDQRLDYNDGTWSTVCRPKVGERIVGGGFLAVYKKKQPSTGTEIRQDIDLSISST